MDNMRILKWYLLDDYYLRWIKLPKEPIRAIRLRKDSTNTNILLNALELSKAMKEAKQYINSTNSLKKQL